MSQRTYIGPFGRILPVLGDDEPEHQPGPLDETRSTMVAYQLPQPPLNFGSDATLGFTDPTRYNTTSKPARRPHDPRLRTELPPVNQLLTPSSQSSIPPSPRPSQQQQQQQRSPEPARRRTSAPSQRSGASDHGLLTVGYPYQGSLQGTSHPFQNNNSQVVTAPRDSYEATPLRQQQPPPAAYVPQSMGTAQYDYARVSSQGSYPAPHDLPQASNQSMSHQGSPQHMGPYQSQQGYPAASSAQYYQENTGGQAFTSVTPTPSSSDRPPSSSVKPAPRVVREDVIPGEGPVWVYADGTTCPKIIDGEPVNAQWGITKAGKPRKRLAIACTTCREKKIKCDPAEPKCAQCEKFGRDCRYQTAPRNQQSTPESPSHDSQARNEPMIIKTESSNRTILPSIPKSNINLDIQKIKRRNISPLASDVQSPPQEKAKKPQLRPPLKKRKSNSSIAKPTTSKAVGEHPLSEPDSDVTSSAHTYCPSPQGALAGPGRSRYERTVNPHIIDGGTVEHYMEMYFEHVNAATHQIFPRAAFMRWFLAATPKSLDDLMVIYAMLALGSVFSLRPERTVEGLGFGKIAEQASNERGVDYTLQLVQSRVLLTLYHFACGDAQLAWDVIGTAIRAAIWLKINLEKECKKLKKNECHAYGLAEHALVECRRRTFWSAYVMDHFCGFWSGHIGMFQTENTFLRLPCHEAVYQRQESSCTPYFENSSIDLSLCQVTSSSSTLGSMAYLVQIICIWGDVLNYIAHASNQSTRHYSQSYESFYNSINRRLSKWVDHLPFELRNTPSNAATVTANGTVGIFIKIHTIYHASIIKLNRHIRHDCVPASLVSRNLKLASQQALQVLEMMAMIHIPKHTLTPPPLHHSLKASGQSVRGSPQAVKHQPYYSCSPLSGSTPFSAYAILTAIDILSAGGPLDPRVSTERIQTMTTGLQVVEELSRCWNSAERQGQMIRQRIEGLVAATDASQLRREAAPEKLWKCRVRLDITYNDGEDIFYNPADPQGTKFFGHIGINARDDDILLVG